MAPLNPRPQTEQQNVIFAALERYAPAAVVDSVRVEVNRLEEEVAGMGEE